MKKAILLALLSSALLLAPHPNGQAQSAPRHPNFIVILGEGHGWSSLPVTMDPDQPGAKSDVVMPHFERLAREGMRATQFYAASPRCTPTRAALLTGRSPAALHMTFVGMSPRDATQENTKLIPPRFLTELPDSEKTLPELLKAQGYATAHFGKWHVGRFSPSRHGFDTHDGPNNNGGPNNVAAPSPAETPRTAKLSVDFVVEQAKAGKPFYLQLDQYPGNFAKDQEDMDAALGQLLKALEDQHLADNTYVLYTTDHGAPGRNFPLRGGKGFVSEGGLRVPFLVRGPGIKAGSVSKAKATTMDLLPTIANLAGVKTLPSGLEGGNLTDNWKSGGTGAIKRTREELVFHFPHYDGPNGGPATALILGNTKLVKFYETNTLVLYDLSKDPSERNDLALKQPKKVVELDKRLTDYLTAIGAALPTTNSRYDPTKPSNTNPGNPPRRR